MHDGCQTGFSAIYTFAPENKTGLVVLTNSGEEFYVTYGLTQLLLGNNSSINVAEGKGLPNAYELDGMEFISSRRN